MNQQPSTAEEVSHEIARSNLSTFLTPSSIAAELRPDLDPVAAAAIYTGVAVDCHPYCCLIQAPAPEVRTCTQRSRDVCGLL